MGERLDKTRGIWICEFVFPIVATEPAAKRLMRASTENQVTPFFLNTPDGEKIFAWHVLPLGLYKAHRDELVKQEDGLKSDVLFDSENIRLLMNDPEARLIIHCMCPSLKILQARG